MSLSKISIGWPPLEPAYVYTPVAKDLWKCDKAAFQPQRVALPDDHVLWLTRTDSDSGPVWTAVHAPASCTTTAEVKESGVTVFGSWEDNVTERGDHKWDIWDANHRCWQGKTNWILETLVTFDTE